MGDLPDFNNLDLDAMGTDEDIIELTEPVYEDEFSEEEDIVELVDVVEESVADDVLESISEARIQDLFEKMINEKYGSRMDDLLLTVMEKVVEKEVTSLKKILIKALGNTKNE